MFSYKRVYGKTSFGKRVDLPLDVVSAISLSWFKGIAVATASGRISFLLIKNRDELYRVVSELLIKRQGKQSVIVHEQIHGNAEEIRKYKELLDEGIITQEEFAAKKQQLMGM